MEKTLERVVKDLYGNGQKGLLRDFEHLKTECGNYREQDTEKQKEMEESLKNLATSFSALARNDSNKEAIRKALGKALIRASLIIGMFGTVITLILAFHDKI